MQRDATNGTESQNELTPEVTPPAVADAAQATAREPSIQSPQRVGPSEPDPIQDAIRRRAYELFELSGREHGKDWQDWFRAEEDILSRFDADTSVKFGASGIIDAADWTLTRLKQLGVNLPAGNRLQRARLLIARVNSGQMSLDAADESRLYELTEAQWTVFEQYIIVRATGSSLRADHKAKLVMMLSGATTTNSDSNPTARNTQFELYVGATLAMAGARVALAEPDLLLDFMGEDVGVAAKRVRSIGQLPRRVDEAVEQIRRSQRRGFVAVNVDVLVSNSGAPSQHLRLDQRLEPLAALDAQLRHVPEVVGSMVFGHDALWTFIGKRPRIEIGNFVRFRVTAAAEQRGSQAYEFLAALLTRIKERHQNL